MKPELLFAVAAGTFVVVFLSFIPGFLLMRKFMRQLKANHPKEWQDFSWHVGTSNDMGTNAQFLFSRYIQQKEYLKIHDDRLRKLGSQLYFLHIMHILLFVLFITSLLSGFFFSLN
jgi:hypothetical protein